MNERAYHVFSTPIGFCGLVWSTEGVVGVQLPHANQSATRRAIEERFDAHPAKSIPSEMQRVIAHIGELLQGQKPKLQKIKLDMGAVPPFHQQVYACARGIAPGKTMSYGELATCLGKPGAARAVGQALRKNPFAIIVPCHRVLAAGGKVGGFTAMGGVETKLKMLAIEGVKLS